LLSFYTGGTSGGENMPPTKSRTRKTSPKHIPGDVKIQMEKRNGLANLLTQAAQVEHDVMVQYLFAAFSLKKSVDEGGVNYAQLEMMRGWATAMMLVARQEMEHLGLVSNLLTAIGAAPLFRRPAFPISASTFPLDLPSSLDKFGPSTVLRFVCYEMPNKLSPAHTKYLSRFIPNFKPSDYDGIYRTYKAIEGLFEEIEEPDLFVGPPTAQFLSGGNSVLARGRIYPQKNTGEQAPIYDVSMIPVTDLNSAKKVINQIIEEGEGANDYSPTSHFTRFLKMHEELTTELARDPGFQPARNVVSNPRVVEKDWVVDKDQVVEVDKDVKEDTAIAPGVNYITNPDTQRVMRLFDQAYDTMLLMLMRYFAHTDESDADLVGLQNTVFFPMMTVGIRPLAEILTQLPAHEPGLSFRAGPSFSLTKSLQLLPHRQAAWRVILGELQLLTAEAKEVQNVEAFSPQIRQRLTLIYENFARMTMNFQDAIHARKMQ
jgi:Ferritin-like